jgi:hypothetical protein
LANKNFNVKEKVPRRQFFDQRDLQSFIQWRRDSFGYRCLTGIKDNTKKIQNCTTGGNKIRRNRNSHQKRP